MLWTIFRFSVEPAIIQDNWSKTTSLTCSACVLSRKSSLVRKGFKGLDFALGSRSLPNWEMGIMINVGRCGTLPCWTPMMSL
eukprot:4813504-Amphidinium_carterae.1